MLEPVIKGTQSPQVVSAPSGSALPAWLRVAIGVTREGFPEFIPIQTARFRMAAPWLMSPLL
jgi:hypothetical protein